MNRENGSGELILSIDVAKSTASEHMEKPWRPNSQSWKAFLRNRFATLASSDLLKVRTISFKFLHSSVILETSLTAYLGQGR
jgi:hypothetical protein